MLEHLRQTLETSCLGMKQFWPRSMLVNNHCYLMNVTWHAPFVLQPGQVSHDSPLCGYSEKSSSNLKSRSCKCQSLNVTSACGVIVVILYVNILILRQLNPLVTCVTGSLYSLSVLYTKTSFDYNLNCL